MKRCSALPRRAFMVLGILCLVLAVSGLPSSVASAQQATAVQETATAQQDSQLAPLSLSPIEKAEKDGTALRLSLKDLTKLALQNNLDIAISDTNEELYQQRIIQAYGPYDPVLTASLGARSNKSANTNLSTASTQGSYNQTEFLNWNFGFRRL